MKPLSTVRKFLFVLALLVASATPTSASAPPADPAGQGSYTLQVGTYSNRAAASQTSRNIPEAWVQEVRIEGQLRYRVNYKRFRDRNEALRAQWDLEDLGYKSFIQRLYT